jgi:catechol 2,3-dioxygenase-like lactoylglutathione lyase family enzyme
VIEQLDHACLASSDIDRSLAFYRDILGMKLEFQMETAGEEFETLFGAPAGFRAQVVQFEEGLEISQFISPAGRDLKIQTWDTGAIFLIFKVSNLDEMYSELSAKGVKFVNPPITLKSPLPAGGSLKIAHLHGPDEERISFMEFIKA